MSRADGSVEQVRVGTAVKAGEGFSVTLEPMTMRPEGAWPTAAPRASAGRAPAAGGGTDLVFPNYGRSKGMPISGASLQDLEFYANGSRRSLSDPGKARFHDKERVLLAAIEGEIARQRGGEVSGGSEPPTDDVPPPTDEDAPF